MREKYLPIGTVVLVKGGKKRAMITGFCSTSQEDQTKIYDYSGCVYPEGYLSSDQVCLFDHNQIDKIFFVGYEDEEEQAFKQKLNIIVENLNNQNSDSYNNDEEYETIEEPMNDSSDEFDEYGEEQETLNENYEERETLNDYSVNSDYNYVYPEVDTYEQNIEPFSE